MILKKTLQKLPPMNLVAKYVQAVFLLIPWCVLLMEGGAVSQKSEPTPQHIIQYPAASQGTDPHQGIQMGAEADTYVPGFLPEALSKVDLLKVRAGVQSVPRIRLARLPVHRPGQRLHPNSQKDLFLKTMLPMILQVNEQILSERSRVLEIMAQGLQKNGSQRKGLTRAERAWLTAIANRYKVSRHDIPELLLRMDILPPSLALAQGIDESGWGKSHGAARKNSPFGQRVRTGNSHQYQLQHFNTLFEAVQSYAHNLNTHPAYSNLRHIRKTLRQRGAQIRGHDLAPGLVKYSELGPMYVQKVRTIIVQNHLSQFDTTSLEFSRP